MKNNNTIKQRLKLLKQSGFTLIEIMIVMVIIGILTAVLVTNSVQSAQKRKKETETVALVTNIVATEYSVVENSPHAYKGTDDICAADGPDGNQMQSFCNGDTLEAPQGSVAIVASDDTKFTVTLTGLSQNVTEAVYNAWSAECTEANPMVCTFGEGAYSGD